MTRHEAHFLAAGYCIPLGRDFHELNSTQVEGVIEAARVSKYRKPKNANGSTARYFHARMQRAYRSHA